MNNPQNPVARTSGLVIQDMPDEVLVYDMETNKEHCLNKTAALVWKSCDGARNVPQIAEAVGLQAGEKVADDLVWLAIDQLSANDLLEKPVKADFKGISRRDVIKRIGLTSVVALPVIASLVAPPTALAVGSCACIDNSDCAIQTSCPSTTNCNVDICAP